MIQEVEQAIIDRLEGLSEPHNLKVINAPNANSTIRAKAIALVYYSGSSYEPPQTVVSRANSDQLIIKQKEQLNFSIVVELVDLRCHEESYPLIEAIRDTLSGYRVGIRGFDVFYPTAIDFVALEDGSRYVYRLTFVVNHYPG